MVEWEAIVAVGGLWVTLGVTAVMGFQTWRQSRHELHETVRAAIAAGEPLSTETIRALQRPRGSPARDLRTGVLLSMLAVGLLGCAGLAAATEGGDDWLAYVYAAIVIGSVGVGHVFASRIARDRE